MATESELLGRIERVKEKIAALSDLRPGTLSEQYNVCGISTCRCKAEPPQKHGPYNQLSWSRHGRSRSENVRPEDLASVKAQLLTYKKLRDLVDEWIDAAIELDHSRRARR